MRASDLFAAVTDHSRAVIVLLLVATVVIGAGAGAVEQSSSLDQFQSDSPAAEKLDYAEKNFSSGQENTTTVQLIIQGDNVLSKDALVESLELQRALRANETVNRTLTSDNPTTGVSNFVAITAIQQEKATQLRQQGAELQREQARLNATVERLSDLMNETREIQAEYDSLNRSRVQGEVNNSTYAERSSQLDQRMSSVRNRAAETLTDEQTARFDRQIAQARTLQQQLDGLNASFQQGEINETVYQDRVSDIRVGFERVYRQGVPGVLRGEFAELQRQAEQLEQQRQQLQNGSQPGLRAQIEKLQSMNDSEVESVVSMVLSDGDGGDGSQSSQAFAFMPTSYEPGSTSADATMLVVFQTQEGQTVQGMATSRLVESQKAMKQVAQQNADREVLVFGAGIISEETDQSMADSIAIVGPMALLFVVVTLLIAYRDLIDIALGVFGIFAVLIWTFGFMGWANITFNQIFIAVPVLLIGLSIDYAIHVFMRHREEREEHAGESVRQGMAVALASVGVALIWVTATTVIGFLSNMVSPLPPIQDFGIVSSVGILAALVVFGALVPALKVELDGFLENRGFDRRKRAFGTGGGALGSFLSVGAVAARKAPFVVIALTLVVSAAGAYGATQVDTSFSQEDFLAEDPPGWMENLPEPFKPGEYSAKANLDYVNENFLRQDSQAQILIERDVATPQALDRIQQATDRTAESDVAVVLSNGEPRIQSPLSVMKRVAAQNESFNATFTAADTDGDGVPDENVEGVYDHLFEVAPDQAQNVIHREDGEYRAVRMVVSVKGGAPSSDVTDEMRDVASIVDGDGLTATATGQPIVFEIVQQQLLETVIESLLITLIAVFAFLMLTYRLTHGSAVLGAITLMPVAFSVSWILGTMYLLGMPFNVLTGMITSLTVGLGVAYSIHLSERFNLELARRDTVDAAMRTSVTGTGGALLGSAATTVGGFGVLSFAILPALQQFGIITGLTIVYAFLASVLVLPSLLVLWVRYLGPDPSEATSASVAAANGGSPSSATDDSDWVFENETKDSSADRPDSTREED